MNALAQHDPAEAPLARSPDLSARVAGVGRSAICDAIKAGTLRARKLGKRTLIADADLRAWIDSLPLAGPFDKAA
jgi:excisionase family DNA binding protein